MQRGIKNRRPDFVTIFVVSAIVMLGKTTIGDAAKRLTTGKDIKKNAIKTEHIRNRTIKPEDLSRSIGTTGPTGPAGAAGGIGSIASATDDGGYATSSTSMIDVPGMNVSYTVPANATKLIVTFNANCKASTSACSEYIQLSVDGTPINPLNSEFCSAGTNDLDNWSFNVIQRVANVTPGPHTVKAQYQSRFGASLVQIDDTTLTVQAAN